MSESLVVVAVESNFISRWSCLIWDSRSLIRVLPDCEGVMAECVEAVWSSELL